MLLFQPDEAPLKQFKSFFRICLEMQEAHILLELYPIRWNKTP